MNEAQMLAGLLSLGHFPSNHDLRGRPLPTFEDADYGRSAKEKKRHNAIKKRRKRDKMNRKKGRR